MPRNCRTRMQVCRGSSALLRVGDHVRDALEIEAVRTAHLGALRRPAPDHSTPRSTSVRALPQRRSSAVASMQHKISVYCAAARSCLRNASIKRGEILVLAERQDSSRRQCVSAAKASALAAPFGCPFQFLRRVQNAFTQHAMGTRSERHSELVTPKRVETSPASRATSSDLTGALPDRRAPARLAIAVACFGADSLLIIAFPITVTTTYFCSTSTGTVSAANSPFAISASPGFDLAGVPRPRTCTLSGIAPRIARCGYRIPSNARKAAQHLRPVVPAVLAPEDGATGRLTIAPWQSGAP